MRRSLRGSASAALLGSAAPLLLAVLALLWAPAPVSAQIGTTLRNISSESSNFTWIPSYSDWRSDTEDGIYQAYSNESDAAVSFVFVGVGFSYLAEKRPNRGLCLLTVDDGAISQTIDLYDSTGFSQGLQVIYTSGTLQYARHNVSLMQIGPDARLGYYPFLATSTWLEVVPTDPATPYYYSGGGGVNIGAIVGGTIGGVIAAVLLGFLFYLWRRDKAQRRRSEGAPVERVKKSDSKMAIDDEPRASKASEAGAPFVGYNGGGAGGWPGYPGGYPHDPYAYVRGSPQTAYARDSSITSGSGYAAYPHPHHHHPALPSPPPHAYQQQHVYFAPPHSAGSGSAESSGGGKAYYESPSASGDATSDSRSYPYHVQGFGNESRSYPVPEI
ncbi:hypothetical protein Rhopal_004866-T1 [Rhodotorula paludigena]|uniref:Uncharacterized protein n=1 Tax=Rhodotorula paludigena TaxID=86838 RepID=A0AAV5GNT9_9BASI|nr:hypothetical protein Rhopal_004866-T1 [Rhodotorula paludigena]